MPGRFEAREQTVGAAGRVPCGHRGRHLGAHLVTLRVQRRRLAPGVRPLARPAPLVGVPLLQVGVPAGAVDVERGPPRAQVEDPVPGAGQQGRVVTDHHQPALMARQEAAPGDRGRVQMVRRLVQQQRAVPGEQDARQFHAGADRPTAR
ncbi:hypothetical protein [Streptomyces luteogriseus]|uniref:hypothetical protein n=1 Tax=Streptomyces luteogriseus TaxID=68233 RepID=UPI003722CC23